MAKSGVPYVAILGVVLLRERERRGWAQDELAERIGISAPQLSKYETGKSMISLPHLWCLANAFETKPSELLRQVEKLVSILEKRSAAALRRYVEQGELRGKALSSTLACM